MRYQATNKKIPDKYARICIVLVLLTIIVGGIYIIAVERMNYFNSSINLTPNFYEFSRPFVAESLIPSNGI
ncbi:MAG: hypothetical protein Edafosvirus4_30 [Edafosvirus sp.]|uniref:Uncharacterized protein n=1 Tax=Edafosvirus sp. TaxID=2487765 RepID=A0A3G4ZT22_9VIRU|nr:MAG: hypothetical protein Edafosvirus4_30 [Edafosvirus sp.]